MITIKAQDVHFRLHKEELSLETHFEISFDQISVMERRECDSLSLFISI